MKFYIASSFQNIEAVRKVAETLKRKGFTHTYDWTQNEKASTASDLKRIGLAEKEAVGEANFLVVLLPAGKGSHVELGLALAMDKPVFLYAPDHRLEDSSTFYHLTEVTLCKGTRQELIDTINRSFSR
ncbi:nucleoside 2-deoxyribosyltransferase [Thalassobacillus hwangdonensis]|uniref:Nucleoside 2-deoxyribosyltransferase n=1 Tax=Thalassobacillus hwangdonensis TaxID=546108 RepID=A0ABW3L2F9_9BACI